MVRKLRSSTVEITSLKRQLTQREQLSRSTAEKSKNSIIRMPLTPVSVTSTEDTGNKFQKTTSDSEIYRSEYSRQTAGVTGRNFDSVIEQQEPDDQDDNYQETAIVLTKKQSVTKSKKQEKAKTKQQAEQASCCANKCTIF